MDTSVNSGFNPQFSDLGSLSIIRTTTQPTSKLLIWATFSSANDTPGSTNHFRITINGSQEEGCATSLYGPDSVVESGSMVVSVGPLPVGTYTIKVQWKSGVGPVGPTIAFVRPASRSDSEHADLLVMESVV
ncbi:MAG: hypothetical protein ACREMY_05415 [bacterium]